MIFRASLLAITLIFSVSVITPEPTYAANPFKTIRKNLNKAGKNIRKDLKKLNTRQNRIIFGAVAGAIIGAKIFDNDLAGVVVGVAAGTLISNELGKSLDQKKRTKVESATVTALATGNNQTWSGDDKKTSGTVNIVTTENIEKTVSVNVNKANIDEMPELDLIGETYVVLKNANMRGGPGTEFNKVGRLRAGMLVNVIGRVKSKPWLVVSSDAVAEGFVFEELLKENGQSIIGDIVEPIDIEVYEVEIADSTLCHTLEQSVKSDDGTLQTETIRTCKTGNGWQVAPTEISLAE